MLALELINRARERTNDDQKTGFSDIEWLQYLNASLDWVSNLLISMKHENMASQFVVDGERAIPNDWVAQIGRAPVYFNDQKLYTYTSVPVTVRYWCHFLHVLDVNEDMRTPAILDDIIITLMTVHALNSHEFDISQDLTMLEQKVKMLMSARQVT